MLSKLLILFAKKLIYYKFYLETNSSKLKIYFKLTAIFMHFFENQNAIHCFN